MNTTFAQLRGWGGACKPRYKTLAKTLGGIRKYGKDTPIPLSTILESNGMEDVWWVLDWMKLTPEQERDFRLLACDFAEIALPIFEDALPSDKGPRECIDVARRYAYGQATMDELLAAYSAARSAASSAARSAMKKTQTEMLMKVLLKYEVAA